VELLTLMARADGSALIRLAHSFGVGEDPQWSGQVTVDLSKLFTQTVKSVTELSLTANQPIGNIKRLTWNTMEEPGHEVNWIHRKQPMQNGTMVTLGPMEIHTFSVVFGS